MLKNIRFLEQDCVVEQGTTDSPFEHLVHLYLNENFPDPSIERLDTPM